MDTETEIELTETAEIETEIETEDAPTIEKDNSNSFDQFALSPELLRAVKDLGYESPSPIQIKTIPLLLEGKDIVGQAQTGTGKTAAFALPALHRIDTKSSKVQVLVMTPTRELAIQVAEAFHSYARHIGRIKVVPIYGGQAIFQQFKHLKSHVQVVVGTPGRIMDHMRRETLDISSLKMVILDEADEMLRMGFSEDVEWILSHTPESRQTALFSATMPKQVRRIADKYITEAVNIEIERKTMTVPLIQQYYLNVSEGQKVDALTRLLETSGDDGEAVLIFHRTKLGAADLAVKLQARGYAAEAMHGDMSQAQRESAIKRLKNGQVEIVVATDVAARGLDVERIATVINYDMPSDTENYVHRIGRTGRAGRSGQAILFVTPRQQRMKRDIERFTGQDMQALRLPTQADVATRRMAVLKDRILKTLKNEQLDLHLSMIEDLADDSGFDIAEIAAAAVMLASGDKPIKVSAGAESSPSPIHLEGGMTTLFIEVGREDRISPADVVGAIANEGDVPGKTIGSIDVYDRYTLVGIPSEYTEQVISKMKQTRIRGKKANIRVSEHGSFSEEKKAPKRSASYDDAPPRARAASASSSSFSERPAPRRRPESSFEDRPAYKPRAARSDDRPAFRKSFDDKPAFRKSFDDRPAFKRPSSEDRPIRRRAASASDDRPAFKPRASNFEDRPVRRSASSSPGFDRKPASRKPYQEFDDKPIRKKRISEYDDGPAPVKRSSLEDRPIRRKTKDESGEAKPFYTELGFAPAKKSAKAGSKKAAPKKPKKTRIDRKVKRKAAGVGMFKKKK